MTKPKVLIVSDSARICSGMGVAHLEIAKGLYDSGKYTIASFGWFWSNAAARGMEWNLPWPQYTSNDNHRPYGHPVNWPNSSKDDLYGSSVYQAIEKFKPDVVIGIGDVWMLDYISSLPNRKSFKFIWEFPIDGEPIPESWVEIVKKADIPVVMSQYASKVIRQLDPFINLQVIPRGIDLRLFRPIKPIVGKDALRKVHMPKAVGKFVVGMFDRFQDRKQINRGVEAFKKFIANNSRNDAVLYLHMDVRDPASIDQGKHLLGDNGILNRYGVLDRTIYNEDIRVESGVEADKLVELYNCCDVRIASTQGEGWGLCTVEAMACGVPNIATDYTTLPELIGDGRGMLSSVKAYMTGMYNVERALVDTDHMAAQIDALYCSPELRRYYVNNALKWVGKLDWSYIIPQWTRLVDLAMHKRNYYLFGKPRDYAISSPFKEITLYGAIKEDTGWAITTRGLAEGLTENKAIVSIQEGGGSIEGYKLSSEIDIMRQTVPSHNIHVINHMPDTTAKLLDESGARIKIAFFPFELPKMEPKIVEALNRKADIFLTPSQFCADMATNAGVQNAHVLDIHSDINLEAKPYKIPTTKNYKFLCVGNLGDVRKNVKTLIQAYLKTFNGDDDVCLVLKSLPGHQNSDPSEIVENERRIYDLPADILVIHAPVDPNGLYNSCDCLVQPTRTEGFCAPIYEAMHFGMPVIATDYGGHTGYMKASDRNILLPFKKEDAKSSPVYKRGDTWAEVDFKSLCTAMRAMYDARVTIDPTHAIKTGGWENTGKQLIDYINQAAAVKKINIYFENQELNLWNNDNQVNLKRYAPNKIRFVSQPEYADIQIVNITRLSDIEKIKCTKYVVLFHCRGEWSDESIKDYLPMFEKALFVYSHQDLKAELHGKYNFVRGPWGTDDWNFYQQDVERKYKILNTGLVPETEAITESLRSCELTDSMQLHVGRNLGYKSSHYNYASNLTSEEMRIAYNSSQFVSGMRRIEGFEKPVIEGLLCGARPICFDTPLFRYWYDGMAEFVPEGTPVELVGHLTALFRAGARPVTETEKNLAIRRFGWKNVAFEFWGAFDRINR